jgi:hypothetical protein
MGATSATGTGPGESHGVPKPENNSGCGGKPPDDPPEPEPPVKRGCFVTEKSGNVARASGGGGASSIKVC